MEMGLLETCVLTGFKTIYRRAYYDKNDRLVSEERHLVHDFDLSERYKKISAPSSLPKRL